VIDAVASPDYRDAFGRRTGVEPHEVEEVVFAEYEGGVALLARGEWLARDVVLATEQRMNTVETRADAPIFRRSGFLGTERVELAALDEHVVLYARGVPEVVAQILAHVLEGRFPEGLSPAIAGESALHHEEHREAPIALYVPHGLDLPPGYGTSTLLRGIVAMAATAGPAPPPEPEAEPEPEPDPEPGLPLLFVVDLSGELPPGAEENLRNLVQSVAQSPLGGALGMLEGLSSLRVQVDDQRSARLSMTVDARQLAMGLRLLFSLEIRELFEPPGQPRN
jgi:hypothetical protein